MKKEKITEKEIHFRIKNENELNRKYIITRVFSQFFLFPNPSTV